MTKRRRMGLVMYRQGNVVDHTPIQWLPVAPPPQDARRPGTLKVCVQAPGRNQWKPQSLKCVTSNRSQCSEEFNWLERTEGCLREQRATHDRREVIDEEINLHEVGLGRRKQGWRMEGAGPVD